MTDNAFHAALMALFLAVVCATAASHRDSVLAAERLAAQCANARGAPVLQAMDQETIRSHGGHPTTRCLRSTHRTAA